MNKKKLITTCVFINGVFIVAHIYKCTQFVYYNYQKQQEEQRVHKQKALLDLLNQQWYAVQDRSAVQLFAKEKLNMKPISLRQVKRLAL
jgi:maltodextrin utilization protein YvdJ